MMLDFPSDHVRIARKATLIMFNVDYLLVTCDFRLLYFDFCF